MKNRAFHFEIKDLLTQFVAAFDDTVISRYNKSRQKKNNIEVRYVFAPKQRVLYDIVNKAQNLTLPVVAINLTGITRDESRVFNKLAPADIPAQQIEAPNAGSKFLMPVPVNLEVSMSILARYMQDVDQIVSNFALAFKSALSSSLIAELILDISLSNCFNLFLYVILFVFKIQEQNYILQTKPQNKLC